MLYNQLTRLRQQYRIHQTLKSIPDEYWAKKIVEFNVSLSSVEFQPESGNIFLKPLNLSVEKNKHDFLLEPDSLNEAKSLVSLINAQFLTNDQGQLILEIQGLKMIVETAQELSIIREIFLTGVYNLIDPRPLVVIDIGMNTGFVSLYFAAQNNVDGVFSYEPFELTYQQGLRNFALNPEIATKIHPFDYGLGGEDQTLTVEYDYSYKGSVGIEGIDENYKTPDKDPKSVATAELRIKSISPIFADIISQYPEHNIVAKIDCEGSEYAIIDLLHTTGQLKQIKVIMMEWHKKGPEPLIESLKSAGFTLFSRLPKSKNVGMIYGINNRF